MSGVTDLTVAARRSLLDALEALEGQREALVLAGAQAIYLYTGDADVAIATHTDDGDIALDPPLLAEEPRLEEAMARGGFSRNLKTGQPGDWLSPEGIPVELLAPETLVPRAGRRAARLPPHSTRAARKVLGLEAAVVDYRMMTVQPLDESDREYEVRVASPAALLVAKSHKLGERKETPHRLVDKDAHDMYRLLRAVDLPEIVDGYRRLLNDDRSASVTRQSIDYLGSLFDRPEAIGAVMAGRAEEGVGDPGEVAASVSALVNDLLDAFAS